MTEATFRKVFLHPLSGVTTFGSLFSQRKSGFSVSPPLVPPHISSVDIFCQKPFILKFEVTERGRELSIFRKKVFNIQKNCPQKIKKLLTQQIHLTGKHFGETIIAEFAAKLQSYFILSVNYRRHTILTRVAEI